MPEQKKYMGFNEFASILVNLMKKKDDWYLRPYIDHLIIYSYFDHVLENKQRLETWKKDGTKEKIKERFKDDKIAEFFAQIVHALADDESEEAESFRNMLSVVRSPYEAIDGDNDIDKIEALLRVAKKKEKECPEVIYELLRNIDINKLQNVYDKKDMVKGIVNLMMNSPFFNPEDAQKFLSCKCIVTDEDYIQLLRHLDASVSKRIMEEEKKEFPDQIKLSEYYKSMNWIFTILTKVGYHNVTRVVNDLKQKYSSVETTMEQYQETIEEENRKLKEEIAELKKQISKETEHIESIEKRLLDAINNFNKRNFDAFRGRKLKEDIEYIAKR